MAGRSTSEPWRRGIGLAAVSVGALFLSVVAGLSGVVASLDVLADLRAQMALGSALLILLSLWARAGTLAVAAGIGSMAVNLIVIAPHYPLAAPVRAEAAGRADSGFTVLHLNAWRENGRLEAVPQFLRAQGADVVVLLEATPALMAALSSLGDLYPYRADCAATGRCGLAILSRRPLTSFSFTPRVVLPGEEAPPLAVARIEGLAATLVVTHPARPWEGQGVDMAALLRRLRGIDGPVILSGDFNAAPWSASMQHFLQRSGLVRAGRSWGTWPSPMGPFGIPIDHILVSPGVPARGVHALAAPGSDHRAVLARFDSSPGAGLTR
jgi:endonuclease/exonuclease/phosphatase (EEP) superfamily protein YafD